MALTPRLALGTRLKRLAFVLVVLAALGGALGALLLSAQAFGRVTRATLQVDALFLARRPLSGATLRWRPAPPGARLPDGVTLEDIRQAYLLAYSELTYAHRSGDTTGLPGRLSGEALRGAAQVTTPATGALLLDWAHQATPLGGPDGTFRLRDTLWTLRALPGPDGWQPPVIRRETRDVTLSEHGGVWRVSRWQVTAARAVPPPPPPPLAVQAWRAVAVTDWSDWTREEWTATLDRLTPRGLGPLVLTMPAVPTLNTGRALGLATRLARQRGVGTVVAFESPFTPEGLPGRVTAALQAGQAVALLPGPLAADDPLTRAALAALRAAQPLPLVTEGAAGPGESARVAAAPEPGALRRLPGAPRLPWKRRAYQARLQDLPRRGWLAPSLDALMDGRGALTPLGEAVLGAPDAP